MFIQLQGDANGLQIYLHVHPLVEVIGEASDLEKLIRLQSEQDGTNASSTKIWAS